MNYSDMIEKAMAKAQIYYGPRGGKYSDPKKTIPYKEGADKKPAHAGVSIERPSGQRVHAKTPSKEPGQYAARFERKAKKIDDDQLHHWASREAPSGEIQQEKKKQAVLEIARRKKSGNTYFDDKGVGSKEYKRAAEDQYEAGAGYLKASRKMPKTARIGQMIRMEAKRLRSAKTEEEYLRMSRVGASITMNREQKKHLYRFHVATQKMNELSRSPMEGKVMSMPTGSIKRG